ncbi:CRISPR system precrRNA processing endoribonuclease RAMP protein Cas6 [Meiothermus sp.]|uniref:CRISPR system precrRNA processing endoribonuclease RAMP protein Cas6 n=1 Tax=Meiothermus sp. TaxID=1955249 RepID=UPI00262A5400|nr:CRISPR system precrRNA processing endoribonuclease RAMP protein Cas6 [Meiothermus sp.]
MLEFDLPIGYLRVGLKAIQPIRLPAFAGSKLEGAFGRTLYQIACTRRDLQTCAPCPLRSVCPYAALYAPALPPHLEVDSLENPPRPLVFETHMGQEREIAPGEAFEFGLRIVGKAVQHLPYLVAAIQQMGENGIGLTRGRFELTEVRSVQPYTGETRLLASADSPVVRLEVIPLNAADLPSLPQGPLTLHLETLTHLKSGGKMVETLQFPVLVRALQRRVSNLEQIYGGGKSLGANFSELPLLARGVELVEQQTRHAVQARSGKGKHPVIMNGLVGRVTYSGDLRPFSTLLRFGELVGMGKWAHFGAGKYRIASATQVDDVQ